MPKEKDIVKSITKLIGDGVMKRTAGTSRVGHTDHYAHIKVVNQLTFLFATAHIVHAVVLCLCLLTRAEC